jgi:hypothetical protein
MRIRLAGSKDLAASVFFVVSALIGLWALRNTDLGSAMDMGPGYIPFVLCLLLGAIGLVVGAKAWASTGEASDPVALRPMVSVTVSVLLFAFAIEPLGLIAATFAAALVAGLADASLRRTEIVVAAVVLCATAYVLFVVALQLPIPVFPDL